jgi:ATP-dependent exoDNAse (exonuclease V) beta subunit (contains helicase and exonuclease domains)
LILFDYKTDHVNSRDQQAGVAKLVDRYAGQVNLYALALQQMTGQPILHQYLYLLEIGKLVAVAPKPLQTD